MNLSEYGQRMAAVYGHIYQDRYNLHQNELDDAKHLLQKNISEFGLDQSAIGNWRVFNVGTGREAVAAVDLGAKESHIADISPLTSEKIRHLQKTSGGYANIFPYHADICESSFSIPAEIDFIYLNGVFHHLYDPFQAARNFHAFLNVGGYLYFRLYRSGSLRFFIADFVRRFLKFEDSPVAEKVFVEIFGPFKKDLGLKNTDIKVHLYEMSFNDMFVPVPTLKLFDPEKLYSFFERNGYAGIRKPTIGAYNHEVESKGGTAYSAYFKKTSHSDLKADTLGELTHTDQLSGISYRESYINQTVQMMLRALPTLKDKSAQERCRLAFNLFYVAQVNRLARFYNETQTDLNTSDIAALDTAPRIHARLQDLLRPYV